MISTKLFFSPDTSFPLSSLRLLVSPLHLASAAMWQMTQRGETMHYGKLEEFVTLVTETVPELLTCRQRAQLIQGLRMRFILELCRSEPLADPQIIQAHVNRLQSYSAPCSPAGVNDAEAEVSEANFLELVQTLLKDPAQREHFFQDVFPVQFGLKYDATLQALVWEFLSRLELLLPVPDLTQTASLLSAAPAGLEECMQCASHQQQLKTLLQHHKCFGQLTTNTLPSMDDSMVSSLSLPPLAEVAFASEQPDSGGQSESTHNPIGALSPSSFGKEAVPECLMDSTDYAGVEVELRTSVGFSEGGEEENGGIDGRTEPNCSEMEKDGQGEGKDEHTPKGDLGLSREREKESGGNKLIHAPKTGTTHPEARLRTWKEAVVTGNKKTGNNLVIALKWLPESQGKVNVNRPRNFSTRNGNTGWTVEANARVFACSKCLVFHSDEGYLHQHIKTVHPEECKEFLWAGERKAGNPVTLTVARPAPAPAPAPAPTPTPTPTPEPPLLAPARPDPGVPRTHSCSLCGKSFKSPSDRTRHERTHTGERPFHCAQCGKRFITAWDLTRHRRTHAGKLPFYCAQCGDSFRSSAELAQHRLTHPSQRRYGCRQCGGSFDSLLERARHRQTHAVRRQHKCPQCEKSYTRPSDMRRHQRSHTGERPYHCSLCGKTFRSSTGEKKHQQTHTGERPFPCSHCGKRFTRLPILTRHERIHTGERPYLCSKCGKSFLSLGELSKHQRCHTEERPYLCAHCGKGFKREGTLMKHRRTHTGERPYSCSHCEKTFTDRSGLNRHELIHTGERPYSCSQCGKTFLSSGELLKHQRFHTGERPFSCSLCGKTFTQSCYLKRHERSHTGERPYSCPQCRKTFSCSTQLKRHARVHAEEKPFQCSECGKGFSHSYLMKTHQQTHAVKEC
ncbi:zinc finger protein 665-like isoform X1 [Conger conger]|uniref:zinc finger protein 665-like isoform X1 n=1 Tax=Conger conger TaxID=82655 RepID=UPI002A5A8E92|nr:zinc finger protein 665-like isoform X1 [Conger conger]